MHFAWPRGCVKCLRLPAFGCAVWTSTTCLQLGEEHEASFPGNAGSPGNRLLSRRFSVARHHHVAKTAKGRVHRNRKSRPPASGAPRRPLSRRRPPQDTGNKVSRKATLVGTQNIMLGGKSVIQPEVMIRGDLVRSQPSSSSGSGSGASTSNTAVAMGRYCFLSRGALLRPPGRLFKGYA